MASEEPRLLSANATRSAARWVDEMSRLYYLSRALHVAAELGVADHLSEESAVAVSRLAERTATNPQMLDRLLQFLAAYGVFKRVSPSAYRHTELSAVLKEDHPQSVSANLRRIGAFWWAAVGDLQHAVRTGESAFTAVHGVPFFQYLRDNPELQKRFDDAMARISDADDAAIVDAYDFSGFRRIVDVGGGKGGLLAQILRRSRRARGVLFDQPQVVAEATRLETAGVSARAERTGGDFFVAVPGGGDCYVIKGVLHDFDDDECVKILSNCRGAMAERGCVVIANQDLPPSADGPHPNLTMDMQMMALLNGRERTLDQWKTLFRRAGLKVSGSTATATTFTLVEGKRREHGRDRE